MDNSVHPSPMIPVAPHQRARGTLALSFKRRGASTVLDTLRQEGCLKARFPNPAQDAWPGAVTLNTAGGVAGGDQLRTTITAGPGAAVTIASQAAERIYRALPGTIADIATQLEVTEHAALEWLPQETILFDRAAIRRRLTIDLAPTAWFLGVEAFVFGRTAMQEVVHTATLQDRILLRRAGRLLLHDAIRLEGPVATLLDHPAIGKGARALATILLAAPNAPAHLEPLRAALVPYEAGVSILDDGDAQNAVLTARILAPNGAILRRAVATGLNILRVGRTLPRMWLC